ncbi:hypothetical protein GE061_017277 [Apolygus lucorum]|uniref:Uncharacterized protein n=1 Tax=Apolygus lucorum TaxID=248454 RepID=A0A8S9XAK3_APOLU|nr:hypothetical protein GE061_017277 [Apolygus lucorum]
MHLKNGPGFRCDNLRCDALMNRSDLSLSVTNVTYVIMFIPKPPKETPSDVKLHLAAVNGDLRCIRRLLDSGKVHVDCSDRDGTTPLILSAANGHVECVLELLDQGADPCARRHTGTTALFFAAQSGYTEIASILLRPRDHLWTYPVW